MSSSINTLTLTEKLILGNRPLVGVAYPNEAYNSANGSRLVASVSYVEQRILKQIGDFDASYLALGNLEQTVQQNQADIQALLAALEGLGTGGGAAGDPVSGFFPSNLNVTRRFKASNTLVNTGYTYAGTGRCVVLGVYAANVSDLAGVGISLWLNDTSAATSYALAYEMPIPVGSALQMFKRPKVLEPGDSIDFQTDSPPYVEFTLVAVDLPDSTDYFNVGASLSTVNSTTLRTGSANGDIISSLLVTNDELEPASDNDAAQISILWENGLSEITRLIYSADIYPGQTMEIIDAPFFLSPSEILKVQSNKINALDTILAGMAKPAA